METKCAMTKAMKSRIKRNLLVAIETMMKEAKEYHEDEWSCGFRPLDNGSIMTQMYFGNLWVYSLEQRFTFGEEGWNEKLAEFSLRSEFLEPMWEKEAIRDFVMNKMEELLCQ